MRFLASQAIKGRGQAATVAATGVLAALLFPPLGIVGAGAVALVTLRNGMRAGGEVILLAVLLCGVFFGIAAGNPMLGVLLTLPGWLPLWLLAGLLRSTRSLALALTGSMALGVALVLVLQLATGGADGWREGLAPLAQVLEARMGMKAEDVRALLDILAHWLGGLLGAGLTLQTMLGLMLGRWWQAQLFNPGGFRTEFHALRLSRTESIVALAGLAWLVFVPTEPGWLDHAALVLLTGFFLHGLALCHGMVGRRTGGRFWLTGIYLMLLFTALPTATALAVAGIMDSWLDFRSRLTGLRGPGPTQ